MKWNKKGLIFSPNNHNLKLECSEYAQSPQSVVYDSFVRVYFSTRKKDEQNKYISKVVFVDYTHDFSQIISYSKNEVIQLGKLGTFDEHGIFPFSPLKYQNKIFAFTCGWSRRISVPVETSIGFAFSDDNGITFKKLGDGPILTASLYQPMLVGDPFVRFFDGVFHMWYIYGKYWLGATDTEPVARVYKIAHATSNDGINWIRDDNSQIIEDKIGEHECQALPTVLRINNRYHMYFCYRYPTDFRHNRNRSYRLGYAFSDDLITWKRVDQQAGIDVSDSGWDSEMICYPHLFEAFGKVYLMYNGNDFGKYGFGLAELESL